MLEGLSTVQRPPPGVQGKVLDTANLPSNPAAPQAQVDVTDKDGLKQTLVGTSTSFTLPIGGFRKCALNVN